MMRQDERFFRWLTGVLLATLLVGGLGGAGLSARAAPEKVGIPGYVVISEFRTTGPNGSNDEFIEIFNRTNNPVDITNWKVRKSSGCGTTLSDLVTVGTFSLAAGQRVLIGNSSGYTGTVDQSYTSSVSDDGGIAIVDEAGNIIDQAGMCSTTTYKEVNSANPSYLLPQSGTADQSYERKTNGCTDTNNNYADFMLQTPSNPQTSTSTPIKCLKVTNVTSTTANGTYLSGTSIAITIEFSSNVNVTGLPTVLLETGGTDRIATYSGGSGSNILTFNYTVQGDDVSDDLDYVATNSLSLNGGTITGAVGDADLTLPSPGAPGSLGANKAIVIDNQDPPSLISFERQNPLTNPTNADVLTFRVTFSEPVKDVDTSDFSVTGTTAMVTNTVPVNSSVYDVVVSGGDLGVLNGDVGLNLRPTQDIKDAVDRDLPDGEPPAPDDEVYTLDNLAPTVTIEQAAGQADPASGTPVNFTLVFSEPINAGTFTAGDITQNGTISSSLITWNITGGPSTFTLSAIAVAGNGTLAPSIGAGRVTDLAGNFNTASTSTDNYVQFTDNVPPSVTVNQAVGQIDPANSLPIRFTVAFSEPIIPSIFTPADITQSGTATGITWSIADSGDHTTFTLSATAVTDYGTLIPAIAPNRVTDLLGNNNTASTTNTPGVTDTVEYLATRPLTVVINEVAWAGTRYSYEDEWIELHNPSAQAVSLDGWTLKAADGSPTIPLSGTIQSGEYMLLQRNDDTFQSNTLPSGVTISMTYGGIRLSDSGEILRLLDWNGQVIDRANENSGAWPAGIASTNSSMQRSLISADSDFVWVTYDETSDGGTKAKDAGGYDIKGTPGRENRPFNVAPTTTPAASTQRTPTPAPGPAPILGISEFLPRPGHDWNNDGLVDVGDEFIEIINAGTSDVDLKGYRLDDEQNLGSSPYTLGNLTLKPGERAVLYAAETGVLLSDAGDTVRLLNSRGTVVDAYTYGVVRYPDQSWCRIPDRLGYWNKPCFPTPGNPNALTGTFPVPVGPATGYSPPLCLLPDTTPEEFVYGECLASGGGIWNRQYWDGLGLKEKGLFDENQKWNAIIQ